MNSFSNLIREDLREFKAYSSARKEYSEGSIFLNANESPWENKISFKALTSLNRYPEPQPENLVEKLSAFYEISTQQILVTSGSDIGIDLLIRLFCYAGRDSILICPPTYGMYEVSARLQGAHVISVNLLKNANFSLDFARIEQAWNPSVKLIFLCSPNNPTGNLLDKNYIFSLCEKYKNKSMIVVDEAYIEYANADSLVKDIQQCKNLVILRTFSKALGFAGIRCGVLAAHKNLISLLNKIITPYPVSTLTAHAASQIFSQKNYKKIQEKIFLIQSERERLTRFFNQCPWVDKVWDSQANFILIETKKSQDLLNKCFKNGIVLRHLQDKPDLENCVRISVGSPVENDFLINTIK